MAACKLATSIIIKDLIAQKNPPKAEISLVEQLTDLVTKIHGCQATSSSACYRVLLANVPVYVVAPV